MATCCKWLPYWTAQFCYIKILWNDSSVRPRTVSAMFPAAALASQTVSGMYSVLRK